MSGFEFPWAIAACPACGGSLSAAGNGASCTNCSEHYPAHRGDGLDLRLRTPRRVVLEFEIGAPLFAGEPPNFSPLAMNPQAEVDFTGMRLPKHLSPEMASYVPAPRHSSARCLDLGCGQGDYAQAVQHAGYQWLGVDYANPRAPMLADAHALPFCNDSFDFVMSLAVLEHIRYPHVMMSEVHRVLPPGGTLLGTVAYLVPFHLDSFYNMTHYGTCSALQHAGFEVHRVASDPRYLGVRALAFAGLFDGAPRPLAYAAVAPLVAAHRAWWWAGGRLRPNRYSERKRLVFNTGAFMFVARKPGTLN